jgi:hypothetical protein
VPIMSTTSHLHEYHGCAERHEAHEKRREPWPSFH